MKLLNLAHLNGQECKEINDSLLSTIDSCLQGFQSANNAIKDLKAINTSLSTLSIHQGGVIDTLQVVIKDQKKIIKRLKTRNVFSRIGEGILGTIIIWLIIK